MRLFCLVAFSFFFTFTNLNLQASFAEDFVSEDPAEPTPLPTVTAVAETPTPEATPPIVETEIPTEVATEVPTETPTAEVSVIPDVPEEILSELEDLTEIPVAVEPVVVRPEVLTEELIFGPAMGWQTCERVINDECSGPECGSSSAYFKFYWSDLQWAPASFDFSAIYDAASKAALKGQQLDLRPVMPYAPEQSAPRFLKNIGARGDEVIYDDGESQQKFWLVDLNDAAARDSYIELIRALGAQFDADPRIGIVDISIFGLWGEGHIGEVSLSQSPITKTEQEAFAQSYALSSETRQMLVDAYFEAFPHKLKVAQITDVETLRYAVTRGAGVRLDCFGGYFMEKNYTRYLTEAGALDAWRTAPVVAEICGTLRSWADNWGPGRRQYSEARLQEIFERAESVYHLSSLNAKNGGPGDIPEEIQPQLAKFLGKIGYRFELKEVTHQPSLRAGEVLNLKLAFNNAGIAPAYKESLVVAVRFYNEGNEALSTYVGSNSMAGRLPGAFIIEENLPTPVAPAGRIRIVVAIVDKEDSLAARPIVSLANRGGSDGWYEISSFDLEVAVEALP